MLCLLLESAAQRLSPTLIGQILVWSASAPFLRLSQRLQAGAMARILWWQCFS